MSSENTEGGYQVKLFTFEQERVMALRMLGVTGPIASCSESEAERRLRCFVEANKELDDCESDWQDRGEAARQPFTRSEWNDKQGD